MGLLNWFDRKNAEAKLNLARKCLIGLARTAEIDSAFFAAVAQNIAQQLHEAWPRSERDPSAYVSGVSVRLMALSSEELFDRAYAILKAAEKMRNVLPARAEAIGLSQTGSF